MERIDHPLPWSSLGTERHLSVFRFGAGERKAYIQASLHADELPGIGRKRLHIAALPFGIDRIESQGRLAGTRKSCDDDQFPARNFQIDVLQVMHPRTEYFDVVFFHDE